MEGVKSFYLKNIHELKINVFKNVTNNDPELKTKFKMS